MTSCSCAHGASKVLHRVDRALGDVGRPRITADGRIEAVIRKAGDLVYSWGTERVDADDLGDPKALRSLVGRPLLDGHPPGGRMAALADSVGAVLSARREGPYLVAEIRVQSREVQRAIERGHLGSFSAGYTVARIDGQGYQRGITYDHVAILPFGASRCGDECSVRGDSADREDADDGLSLSERARASIGRRAVEAARRETARAARGYQPPRIAGNRDATWIDTTAHDDTEPARDVAGVTSLATLMHQRGA